MKSLLILLIALTAATTTSANDVYKFKDENGTWTYSDKKPEGDFEIVFKTNNKKNTREEENTEPVVPARTIDSVNAITNSLGKEFNAIYQAIYNADQAIKGSAAITFTIVKEGNVSDCKEDESGMEKAGFEGKLCEKIVGLNYGPVESELPLTVTFTYTFKPSI